VEGKSQELKWEDIQAVSKEDQQHLSKMKQAEGTSKEETGKTVDNIQLQLEGKILQECDKIQQAVFGKKI
jgi:uncharacterized protein YjbJ (UPF0337 family)